MHYLKIISKGWQGYNGQLNIITFKNGISTEPVQPVTADRIAASVTVVKCDAEGNEGDAAEAVGPQHRLISETLARAPIATPLAVQSDADKNMEAKLDAARSLTAPVETLYTRTDLEKLADESGIKGLRDVGDKWDVKGRGIPEIIEKILAAQAAFLLLRNQKMEKAGGSLLKATSQATDADLADEAAQVAEEVPTVAGFEGLLVEYKIGDKLVTGVSLTESALKNSGKSLTGWNNLRDPERAVLIGNEIEALEKHYDAKLEPVVVEPAVTEEPAKEVLDAEFEAKVKEALETWEPKITEAEAIALVRANLAAEAA